MIHGYFKLDPETKAATPCDSHEWAKMFDDIENRRVAHTKVGQFLVSTIFLGIDRNFGRGPPLLFETMIFSGNYRGEYQKCSETWSDAELEHNRAVSIAQERMRKAGAKSCRQSSESG